MMQQVDEFPVAEPYVLNMSRPEATSYMNKGKPDKFVFINSNASRFFNGLQRSILPIAMPTESRKSLRKDNNYHNRAYAFFGSHFLLGQGASLLEYSG